MNFEEVNGIQTGSGIKVVIYGQEGVGKSSLAADFPDAVFIDCEGSTSKMNVRRLPKPTSWTMLCEEMNFVLDNRLSKNYRTVIIDTFDWAERLALDELCAEHKVNGIEGMNYGKGWQYEAEKIGRFLDSTEKLISDSYQRILEHFSSAKVLGVTATPDRGDMKNLGRVFQSLAYEYTLPQAIKEGYLSPIRALTDTILRS